MFILSLNEAVKFVMDEGIFMVDVGIMGICKDACKFDKALVGKLDHLINNLWVAPHFQ